MELVASRGEDFPMGTGMDVYLAIHKNPWKIKHMSGRLRGSYMGYNIYLGTIITTKTAEMVTPKW